MNVDYVDYLMLVLYILVGLTIMYYAYEMYQEESMKKERSNLYWLSIMLMVLAIAIPIIYILVKF